MEDDQGDVCRASSGGVTASLLSGKSTSEAPVEKIGCESYEEGDGGEVMVEVVGFDVFVDGQKKGHLGSGEIRDLEGNEEKNVKEIGVKSMDAVNEGGGCKMGVNEEGESNYNVSKGVDASSRESVGVGDGALGGGKEASEGGGGDGDLDGGVGKNGEESGINAMEVSSEGEENKNGENDVGVLKLRGKHNDLGKEEVDVGFRDSVTGEESQANDMNVPNKGNVDEVGESEVGIEGSTGEDNDIVTGEVVACVKESDDLGNGAANELQSKGVGVLDNEASNTGIESVVVSSSVVMETVSGQTEEFMKQNTVTIHEKKVVENEAIDRSRGNLVTSENLNQPVESVGEEKVGADEKDKVLSLNDGQDGGHDPVTTAGATDAADSAKVAPLDLSLNSNFEGSEGIRIGGIDGGGNTECAHTHGDCGAEAKFVDEKEFLAVETGDSIHRTHSVGVQDENQGSLKETSEQNCGNDDNHEKTLLDESREMDMVHQDHIIPDEGNKESDAKGEAMEVDCAEPLAGTEPSSESDKLKLPNEEAVKAMTSVRMHQSGYLLCQEGEGHFTKSDLVWGKVRSHPWWPGQIFDPEDASETAVKYHKKDSYLVAYFGDRTFAWNDASVLKPFRSHFSQIEKQSNSEAFQNAVDCALEEVSRRVELGLACSCIPKDAHRKIECQIVENSGIREESSHRYGVDRSTDATSFEPDKFLEYITDLAPCASFGADRLDLKIVRAVLSAFCCFKGYRLPSEFPSSGELLENEADTEQISSKIGASEKHKHIPNDDSRCRKERSLVELMGDGEFYPDVEDEFVADDQGKLVSPGKKRKALSVPDDRSEKKLSVSGAKLSSPTSQPPKPSFKIGECIRRVASQLTGSTALVKSNNDEPATDGSPNINELSVDEILSQLELLTQNPKKRQNMPGNVHNFFLGFRSSIALNRRGRKRKDQSVSGSGEEFEFDDVNDSYWMDRIVLNYPAEQLQNDGENGGGNFEVGSFGEGKPVKLGRKPHSRKRYSTGNYPLETIESDEIIKRKKQQSSPAELILNFAEKGRIPSEINLNKMFRRFGSLMESETEVDHESGRAKVIYKRGSDAEVARNSAEKFNIFGSALVNYEIGYSPVISVKILPIAVPQLQEDEALMI